MHPELLLHAALAALRANPPPGLTLADIDAFAARQREALLALIARSFPAPSGTPTPGGGLRGEERPPEQLQVGERVVTEAGEHGEVADLHRTVTRIHAREIVEHVYFTVEVRLDSGRTERQDRALYAELRPPAQVVPDLRLGERWISPARAWDAALRRSRDIAYNQQKAEAARNPSVVADWRRRAQEARAELRELLTAFAEWRARWPDAPVPGFSPLDHRRLSLEALPQRTEDERWELAWLARVPEGWAERVAAGDRVVLHRLGPHGREPSAGWTVQAVQGHTATLTRGAERREEPLWMLRPDQPAPAPSPPQAQAGCVELVFELPGYGVVRVVCGARGRRESWHNLYVLGERYGFNGARWARGERPPEAVLRAVRERGVGVFG